MKINFKHHLLLGLVFFFILDTLDAQSKFEYGIGIMINHSKINEEVFVPLSSVEGSYKVNRQLALTTRIGYKPNDKFHINSGVGFSWLGSLKKNLQEQVLASTVEVPLLFEWNPKPYLHFSTGPLYNYVYSFASSTKQNVDSLLPFIHSRHQLGLRHGIGISHQLIEFSLSYSHYFTDIFQSSVTDVNGNEIGTSVWKFSNIQLGIIFRG